MSIPIENLYYLLCYAWDKLDEGALVDVNNCPSNEVYDLLAKVLIGGVTRLIKSGIDRGYVENEDALGVLRGRILIDDSLRKLTIRNRRLCCRYDELHYDVLHNRILKAAMTRLIGIPSLDADHRNDLLGLVRRMPEVSDMPIVKSDFARLQLHRNTSYYIFLMNICELVIENTLVDENEGCYRFRDFLRDERKMARLFERFVYNFYKKEQCEYSVASNRICWDAISVSTSRAEDLDYLPTMLTDITLRSSSRTLIIDTKYYEHALSTHYLGGDRVHADNLYQIWAYLSNLEASSGSDAQADGLLLYPDVSGEVDLSFLIRGHRVSIRTLNLSQPWQNIHTDLLSLVEPAQLDTA